MRQDFHKGRLAGHRPAEEGYGEAGKMLPEPRKLCTGDIGHGAEKGIYPAELARESVSGIRFPERGTSEIVKGGLDLVACTGQSVQEKACLLHGELTALCGRLPALLQHFPEVVFVLRHQTILPYVILLSGILPTPSEAS